MAFNGACAGTDYRLSPMAASWVDAPRVGLIDASTRAESLITSASRVLFGHGTYGFPLRGPLSLLQDLCPVRLWHLVPFLLGYLRWLLLQSLLAPDACSNRLRWLLPAFLKIATKGVLRALLARMLLLPISALLFLA